ncbi:hypothetical protein HS088_TW02G01112 [Tripterygium wilfordii]|uniref:Late embryogenesis abundant protein n=1 Tax=Tripterygium wilfordii TaxID=458696 RepID=A0A7J7E0P1_TRIWF|nr:uncharacterized protein LOC120014417 [Tripterygium wilfordii]KAF5752091.1 hypothetical protein HS088_TW02G01112 [Tripterygium wilfordii]
MSGAFARGAMFFKPMVWRSYHRKSSSTATTDAMKETIRMDSEEAMKSLHGDVADTNCWIPDDRTGIYYPKGHEQVMADVPTQAGKDLRVSYYQDNSAS